MNDPTAGYMAIALIGSLYSISNWILTTWPVPGHDPVGVALNVTTNVFVFPAVISVVVAIAPPTVYAIFPDTAGAAIVKSISPTVTVAVAAFPILIVKVITFVPRLPPVVSSTDRI